MGVLFEYDMAEKNFERAFIGGGHITIN